MAPLVIITPVMNDWVCFSRLLGELEEQLESCVISEVVAIDDASIEEQAPPGKQEGKHLPRRIITLGANVGHQRAIAVGLSIAASTDPCSPIVVMDSDGEDQPRYIEELVTAYQVNPDAIVVAQRRVRTEGIWFRFLYRVYRLFFRVLTGRQLDFGNFVLLPPAAVQRLVRMNELWNHFPAAVMRSKLPIVKVPIDRGVRYSGESRMNLTALVNHGLAAIAAFIDAVFVRLLVLTGVLLGLFSLAAVAVVVIRVWGTWGVPGWATTALGLILLGLLQLAGLLVVVTFLTLSMRSSASPPPIQFAQQYITRVEKFH